MSAATNAKPKVKRGPARRRRVHGETTVTDLFCGAGGSSSGLATLPGVKVIMAANHWQLAIDSHQLNHPNTDHSSADISQVEPSWFPTTDILWASPECTNHSVAKGIKRQRATEASLFDLNEAPLPDAAAIRSRATMWDVPRFAEYHHYKAIIIENVVDAYRWIPFPAWLQSMELLGYQHQIVWLNSMHAQAYGLPAPQSRDRMYIVFWLKGNRAPDLQKWTRPKALCERHGLISAVQTFKKAEEWGRYRAQYLYRCPQCAAVVEPGWLPASSAIDWTIEGTRIGDREKPLSPKTMTRIEKGIERYWRPTIVEATGNTYDSTDPRHPNHGSDTGYLRAWPIEETFRTLHASESKGLALPPLITDGIRGEGTVQSAADPMLTQTTAQTKGMLVPSGGTWRDIATSLADVMPTRTTVETDALLIPVEGRDGKTAAAAADPLRTQSTRNETAIVVPLRNHGVAKGADSPIDTVSANGNHHALLMRNNTARGDQGQMTTPVSEVMRTLTTAGHQSLLVPYNSRGGAAPVSDPHRTFTTLDRYSLLSGPVNVEDCIFRMLTPDEIKVGMAFAHTYTLLGTKREQVKQAGNAVTPPAARDLGAAVIESLGIDIEMAA
ncbi:DNA cytosine methyltransferase [Subtercola sp. PAMC28395]|uniref:DNA cytosine methyltransferase n=1 Tax=Subtercola sp. PAMC28395 TaxID=2846775 RepID=UPI001C0E7790|nr:DNA cytosine methyltransferase [Subtercola sp. PAMC28395]QWT24963.1 DNA cytosine methyltransferase [Subtercola sp. PAMC28395]